MPSIDFLVKRQQRLEQERDQLNEQWDTLNRKVASLRLASAREAGAAIRFQLEEEIKRGEKELEDVEKRLKEIEAEIIQLTQQITQKKTEEESYMPFPKEDLDLPQLRQKLGQYFTISELKTIAFDLRIDHEELDGSTKPRMVESLLVYLQSRERLPELLKMCREQRPNASW